VAANHTKIVQNLLAPEITNLRKRFGNGCFEQIYLKVSGKHVALFSRYKAKGHLTKIG